MIYILHGEDSQASYARLAELLKSLPHPAKFSKEHTKEDLYMLLFSQSILDNQNAVVCENFFKDKKITPKDELLLKIPKEKTVIFRETSQMSPSALAKLAQITKVENFKPQPYIFRFLDSLRPGSKEALRLLPTVQAEGGLLWNLSNRVFLMTLARLGLPLKQVNLISGRPLADWQWSKITSQSYPFKPEELKAFFTGCLKADFTVKTGKTDLAEGKIVLFLLMKYLKL